MFEFHGCPCSGSGALTCVQADMVHLTGPLLQLLANAPEGEGVICFGGIYKKKLRGF